MGGKSRLKNMLILLEWVAPSCLHTPREEKQQRDRKRGVSIRSPEAHLIIFYVTTRHPYFFFGAVYKSPFISSAQKVESQMVCSLNSNRVYAQIVFLVSLLLSNRVLICTLHCKNQCVHTRSILPYCFPVFLELIQNWCKIYETGKPLTLRLSRHSSCRQSHRQRNRHSMIESPGRHFDRNIDRPSRPDKRYSEPYTGQAGHRF